MSHPGRFRVKNRRANADKADGLGILMASHDQGLIDAVADRTVELRHR